MKSTVLPLILALSVGSLSAMSNSIFREYDIRGKVGSELLIEETYAVARAIAYYFVEQNPRVKKIAVGMDGRIHSSAIKKEVCRAFTDSGLDVAFVGVCTSPALYFAINTTAVDGGIMITASHNPAEYNGMKICLGTSVVWGKQIQEICRLYKAGAGIDAAHPGSVMEDFINEPYVAWLADHFSHLKGMDLSAVVDCGNGAAGTMLPQLVEQMEWKQVQLLYPEVDGTYPNHEADPTTEKNMQDVKYILATTDVQVGAGLDGDCDRMNPMTKEGFLVPGEQLLALFAKEIAADHPGMRVVFDIKSSAGLPEMLEQWGAVPVMSPSGHAIIKNEMRKHDAILAGELSCHFFFKDRYFGYDDGVYALCRLFEILVKENKSLGELLSFFPKKYSSPEYRIGFPEDKKNQIIQAVHDVLATAGADITTMDGVRGTLAHGWALVRPSNTQPVLCFRFEGNTADDLHALKTLVINALGDYFNEQTLQTQFEL